MPVKVDLSLIRSLQQRRYSLYSPDVVLSEENKKKTIQKFAGLPPPITRHFHKPLKKAAVLIPVCVVDGNVSLLYTLRAANLKTHRGQVSFPGGMHDAHDDSMEQTALRETEEELGVQMSDVEIWGKGPHLVSRETINVLPIVGRIKNLDLNRLRLNTHEVSEIFTVSLQHLCHPRYQGHTQFRGSYCLPVFVGGRRKIWGLTALMTSMFLRALLPKEGYNHKFKVLPQVTRSK